MAVVALLTDVALRLRLADALKGWATSVECVAQIGDVRGRVAAGDVRVLVVGPRDASDRPAEPLVADMRREHPSVTIVAYCASIAGSSDAIVGLIRAGAHALVIRGVDDERHAFRAALRSAEQRCAATLVFERIRDQLPPAVAPLVALYLRADGVPPTVAEAATLLGVHRKTLVNRLAAAGCPTPRALRTWCRLFVAGRLLEEPGRTVESIALQLEFDSTTGLRNAIKRYTGHGASAVRAAGGLAHLLAHFNAACAAQRAHGPAAALIQVQPHPPTGSPLGAGASLSALTDTATDPPDPPASRHRPLADVGAAAARALVLVGALWLEFGMPDDVLMLTF